MTERVGYRVGEIAETLGMAQSTVSHYVAAGSIPVIRVGPRSDVRIPKWWIDQYREQPKPLRLHEYLKGRRYG